MVRSDQLDERRACIVVIDMQVKLLPLVADPDAMVRATKKLIDGARVFALPQLVTEQYPKGIGPTESSILASAQTGNATRLEKPTFSACGHDPIRDWLRAVDRPQIIMTGIETHVCVQQTALDLAAMDYDVFVCADAVSSRGRLDHDTALHRMRGHGVNVTTVESVLFEMCQRCDTDRFKEMLAVIKDVPPRN